MSYEYTWIGRGRSRPIATIAIVAINVAVYLYTSYQSFFSQTSQDWIDALSFIPILLQVPSQWYRIITSMFTHADIFHIFFNMWFLYFFGSEVEKRIGSLKFLVLYFISGLMAIVFHVAFTSIGGSINLVIPALGASGAISGVLGAYVMLYPRRKLAGCYLILIIPLCLTMTASWFLLLWFATQVIYGYLKFGGVAFFAHVGGFVNGIALIYPLAKKAEAKTDLLPGYFFMEWRQRVGLGKALKTTLVILLLAVVGGAIYSTLIAPSMSGVYVYSIKVVDSSGKTFEDQAYFSPPSNSVPPSLDAPRIVFNRFLWSGLLTGYLQPSNEVVELRYTSRIRDPNYGLRIRLSIDGLAMYDSNHILKSFNGTVQTDVIKVGYYWLWPVASVGEYESFSVKMVGEDVAGDAGPTIVFPCAVISTITSIAALYISLYKDREIAEEELWVIAPFRI
ncbi:rhomboid family intramembrane serine protease [Ignisphaera sp. 4213-co]|uniref:Rhomboid family intramembrane serine protease n=1 Tax=Ignisphaera cupida TaxID=3050454 RepID=A0ABD4Z6B6_9CREN|nr:rhomboid family intramembrane serine protease [Ignisphaera sp. 4213-co]MDK6028715.1 rhomboid family intramembrane serine protease [Ignisphaera sp. 4213-co]